MNKIKKNVNLLLGIEKVIGIQEYSLSIIFPCGELWWQIPDFDNFNIIMFPAKALYSDYVGT